MVPQLERRLHRAGTVHLSLGALDLLRIPGPDPGLHKDAAIARFRPHDIYCADLRHRQLYHPAVPVQGEHRPLADLCRPIRHLRHLLGLHRALPRAPLPEESAPAL